MTIQLTKGEAEVLGLSGKAAKLTVPTQKNRTSQGITPQPRPDLPVKLCGTILVRAVSAKTRAKVL